MENIETKKETKEYFRLCDGASTFFNKTKDNPESANMTTELEMYWLCLLMGIITLRKDSSIPERPPKGTEKNTDWTGLTRQYQEEIRAFVMYGYLNNLGFQDVNAENADTIEKAIDDFLQSSGSKLTSRGVKEADKIAHKGWNHIAENKINRTNDLGTFLIKYVDELQKLSE